MIKTLSKVGNSRALILDRTLLDLLHLDGVDQVQIEVHGDTMLVRSAASGPDHTKLDRSSTRLMERFAGTYDRLAK